MAVIRWEVPLSNYLEVCALIAEAHEVSQTGPQSKLDELVERIRRTPGYPNSRTVEDTVVVVPKDARLFITPATKEN
jgi:hypothetical protein